MLEYISFFEKKFIKLLLKILIVFGKNVEIGNHKELMAMNGKYNVLHKYSDQ